MDRGGVILRAADARGPLGGRVGPGRRRHPPCGGGSRSTVREGGTGEVSSSSGRRRLAVHRERGWDRGGVVIIRAAEARGPPGGRVGPGRCHPPGGGGSRSTVREGATGDVSSSSGRRRLAVHREGGCDWGGVVILRTVEGGTKEASSSGRRRLAVHREGGRTGEASSSSGGAEARGPPGGRVGPGRRHPPGGGGSRSTGSDAGTGEASPSSGKRRLAVHREGGWNRGGAILPEAEPRGPQGGRVRLGRRHHPPDGGGSRSTGREGGTEEASSSWRRRVAVNREGGRDRGSVILRAAE